MYLYLADTAQGVRVAATSKDAPLPNPFSVMYDAFINRGDNASRTKQAGWYEVCVENGVAHVPAHASAPVRAYVRDMYARAEVRPCMEARVIMRSSTKIARSTPIGLPGGPCHVIRNIEEENLAPRLRDELIEDIEKGKDLTNAQADKIYGRESFPLQLQVFTKLELTAHGQYRMDLRGVTVPEVKLALDEFVKWYLARKTDPKIKPQDQNLLIDLVQGDPVRFDAKKLGLTIVFMADPKRGTIRLVSTWWTNTPNPAKPKPGECSIIPFLDARDRSENRPAILGSILHKEIIRTAKRVLLALKIQDIPTQMPSSLKSIDWVENTQKWLEEAKKSILKASGVKGKSGTVKLSRTTSLYSQYSLDFGKDLPAADVQMYPHPYTRSVPYMKLTSSKGSLEVETPEDAYQTLAEFAAPIPLMVYARQVVAVFQQTSGAVTQPYVYETGGNVVVDLSMVLGGSKVGKLSGLIKPNKQESWTLNWKGKEEKSSDIDILLDMIDEEGDTMQPIFNNTTKLKKFVEDLSKRIRVPIKKAVGTEMEFEGPIQGIRGTAHMKLKITHDLSQDTWYLSVKHVEFYVERALIEDLTGGPFASITRNATSMDEARILLSDKLPKMFPQTMQPNRVGISLVGGDYAFLCQFDGQFMRDNDLDNIEDAVKSVTDFAGRYATP